MLEINAMGKKPSVVKIGAWLLFGIALTYKIYACFQVPTVTTDVIRHLGYASHALENNFAIYTTKAEDFIPESWTRFYSKQTYIYPPTTLIFFYIFSVFHLGIFWVKAVLTLIDIGCAYLFYKHVSKLAALLSFCLPLSLFYTSHEGQFEILQTLFIILNAISVRQQRWRLAGFWFAISVQVKQFGVLILPWILYEMWSNRHKEHQSFVQIGLMFFQGLILGFLPFLPFYVQTPWLLLLPITEGSDRIYNPFAWNLLNPLRDGQWWIVWSILFSYAPLIVLLIVSVIAWKNRKFAVSISTVPLILFWFINKSLKWANFWYAIVAPGYLFCLSRKSLIHLLLLVNLMQGLNGLKEIAFPRIEELPPTIALLQSCMFTCDPQRTSNR